MAKISRLFTGTLMLLILFSCSAKKEEKHPSELKTGIWRGVLDAQGNELPFNFEVEKHENKYHIYLLNAEERLLLDEVVLNGDSLYLPMHIFDADIKAKVSGDKLQGFWTKNYEEDYSLAFTAVHGQEYRFSPAQNEVQPANFDGNWSALFVHEEDTTLAMGNFKQNANHITGTFLTPTGDYRYLEGTIKGNQMQLSTFDGGHAFLFVATKNEDETISGDFWSGSQWHETWNAQKSDTFNLPDADQLTYLKDGYDKVEFSFPGIDGNPVSPNDKKYDGKVLILQILGTWCPNCMDETRFLAPWYAKNKSRGVEILGLAYEAKDDFDYAKSRILKMKEKLDVEYDIAIAGTKDKEAASKTLPMLNQIISFPTTIFLDKDRNVRRIHTGFTGPGTGHYYEQYIKAFNATVDELLNEPDASTNTARH